MKKTKGLAGARTGLIALVALAFIAGSAYYGYAASAGDVEPAVRTAAVTRGTIQTSVPAEGRIEVDTWELSFAGQGVVAKVRVKPGDEVTEGQVLAELDDARADTQVDQAQAALKGAEAKLDGVLSGPASSEVAVKEASVDAAEDSLDSAKEAYDVLVAESLETTVSESELQSKKTAVANAESALKIADANLTAARAGATDDQVAEARASVTQAKAAVAAALAAAGDSVIMAPVDGTVVSVDVKPGSATPAGGTPAIVIADLDHPFVEATLDENDYAKAESGLPVDVLVDALDGTSLEGTVTSLSTVGEADANGIVTYSLTASLDVSDSKAAAGMTARLDVITERVADVLTIPTEAVRLEGGKQVVSVIDENGQARTAAVALGMTDGSVVEVRQGLKLGDRVALPETEK